jgi:2-keto-3-deoxy-L-rhamnonate aldolase RhmA
MIVSPDAAALIAACRSPPAGTTCVAAKVAEAEMNKINRIAKALVLGEKLR